MLYYTFLFISPAIERRRVRNADSEMYRREEKAEGESPYPENARKALAPAN